MGVKLSPREREILTLLRQELSYRQVAERLGCAYGTVVAHAQRIKSKLRPRVAETLTKGEPNGEPEDENDEDQ